MLFIIEDSDEQSRPVFVKAKDEPTLKERLKLRESQSITMVLTDTDLRVLADDNFVVISAG